MESCTFALVKLIRKSECHKHLCVEISFYPKIKNVSARGKYKNIDRIIDCDHGLLNRLRVWRRGLAELADRSDRGTHSLSFDCPEVVHVDDQ